ncbi:MAG: cadmium-translocating P-type ATPase [Pseudomonadales bacterium]|nr:cadmium-translocating P-type ATPase [Pseudomonadales bacterium]
MSTTTFNIDDMHCASCVAKIRATLNHLDGVLRLQFNPARRQLIVSHENAVPVHELLQRIEHMGFHPYLSGSHSLSGSDTRNGADLSADLLKRLGIAGLSMMQVMTVVIGLYAGILSGIDEGYRRILEYTALLFCIPVVSYSAMPFYIGALKSLRTGPGMDVPIALAIAISFLVSLYATLVGQGEVYYESVVMFTFLLLLARYIDLNLKHRVDTEDALMHSLPNIVTLVKDSSHEQVPVADVSVRDTLWVGEGEQISVDGALISEQAYIDEALLTGESQHCKKAKGENLYAGTFNRGAGIYLSVQAVSEKTRFAAINRLATDTMLAKNRVARLADQIARIFIPCILLFAMLTYFGWCLVDSGQAFSAALAVLVISCPCALSLAIPAALSAAMVRLRHAGVVLKDSTFLELLPKVTDILFDKTGTLTKPKAGISAVNTLGTYDAQWCLAIASALQMYSSHPLARCFSTSEIALESVESTLGAGVQANLGQDIVRVGSAGYCSFDEAYEVPVNTVFMSVNNQPAATFGIENPLRENAQATVEVLQREGLGVHILSGDKQNNCARVADKLGLDFDAEQAPEDKWDMLNTLIDKQHTVMFVGDGINDLPALAGADVSVAMLESNDLVKSKSDIVLFTSRLSALADLFNIARLTRRVMNQNLVWAFSYNVIAIPAAALGLVPPWLAALGMALSSTGVMLNAVRLIRCPLYQFSEKKIEPYKLVEGG